MALASYSLSSTNDETSETVTPLRWHSKSSPIPRQPQDWFSQLPPKVRKAQFSPSEKAHIQRSNTLGASPTYSMHTGTRDNPRLRQSASTSAWSTTSATLSDVTAPTEYTPRLSVESVNSRADHKYPSPAHASCTPPTGGFMTSPTSKSGDNPRPSLSLLPRKVSTSDIFYPTSPTPRRTAPRYLHDPETQTKLKLYFGSEEKFDEVLVYGFPSADEQPQLVTDNPKPTRLPPNSRAKMVAISDYQKALKNDSLAFLDDTDDEDEYDYYDDDDEDENDDDDQNDHEQVEYCYDIPACKSRRSKADMFYDYDNYVNNPMPPPLTPLNDFPTSQSRPLSGEQRFFGLDRDSTLRITLTRPEVRVVDVQNSGDVNDTDESPFRKHLVDLLALEPLEILPDHSAFAILSKQTTRSSLYGNKDNVMKNMFTKKKSKGHSPWLCM